MMYPPLQNTTGLPVGIHKLRCRACVFKIREGIFMSLKSIQGGHQMAIFEDVVLTDTIEINTTPEKVFHYLTSIIDSEGYQAWHSEDHVTFRFIKGKPRKTILPYIWWLINTARWLPFNRETLAKISPVTYITPRLSQFFFCLDDLVDRVSHLVVNLSCCLGTGLRKSAAAP